MVPINRIVILSVRLCSESICLGVFVPHGFLFSLLASSPERGGMDVVWASSARALHTHAHRPCTQVKRGVHIHTSTCARKGIVHPNAGLCFFSRVPLVCRKKNWKTAY